MSSAAPTTMGDTHCRIMVVDDHTIMRDGLSALLDSESDIDIVGTASDGKAAIAEVDRLMPDIIVMDLSMPGTDGAQAIAVIKRKHPDIGTIVLTFHKDDAHIHSALLAGADAYVLKDDGREELLAAIRNVWAGKRYLSPAICDRVMSGYVRGTAAFDQHEAAPWEALSKRELQVLKLVAEGYTSRGIADYLHISEKTVEKHRASMMRKLDLHSIASVTAYAIENGLLVH
jgi:DNA-binding NarL/FixJ family response regulator